MATGACKSLLSFYGMWLLMAVGVVGIGCIVQHDANHGSFSKNKTVNKLFSKAMLIVGCSDLTWRIQHNILHHTYTNIHGLDEDIDVGFFMRVSPDQKRYKFHKYQHLYGWVLYSLLTLRWVTIKDFQNIFIYNREGLLHKENISLFKALPELVFYKLYYYTFILAVPMVYSGMSASAVVYGFLLMHLVAGFLLSVFIQLTHLVGSSKAVTQGSNTMAQSSFIEHQILNSCNYAPSNKFLTWFLGGVNLPIEHHIFPKIAHVHLSAISPIVKKVILAHGLPYHVNNTLWEAIKSHYKVLKNLGRNGDFA